MVLLRMEARDRESKRWERRQMRWMKNILSKKGEGDARRRNQRNILAGVIDETATENPGPNRGT